MVLVSSKFSIYNSILVQKVDGWTVLLNLCFRDVIKMNKINSFSLLGDWNLILHSDKTWPTTGKGLQYEQNMLSLSYYWFQEKNVTIFMENDKRNIFSGKIFLLWSISHEIFSKYQNFSHLRVWFLSFIPIRCVLIKTENISNETCSCLYFLQIRYELVFW